MTDQPNIDLALFKTGRKVCKSSKRDKRKNAKSLKLSTPILVMQNNSREQKMKIVSQHKKEAEKKRGQLIQHRY